MNNRDKFIGILKAASDALAPHREMSADLHTMATALEAAGPEKFNEVIDHEALDKMLNDGSNKPQPQSTQSTPDSALQETDMSKTTTPTTVDAMSGWNDKAASAVRAKLAMDVMGCDLSAERPDGVSTAKLPESQIPDGTHSWEGPVTGLPGQVSGAALPKEQRPEDATSIKTDMVKKSEGPVIKEAFDAAAPTVKPEGEETETETETTFKPEDASGQACAPANETEASELNNLFA